MLRLIQPQFKSNCAAKPHLLFWETQGQLTGPAGIVIATLVAAVATVISVGALLLLIVPLTLACSVPAGGRSPPAPFPSVAPGHWYPNVDGVVIWGEGRSFREHI